MKPKRVTIKQAKADNYGRWCPIDTEFPCTSTPWTEWTTPSGKVYTRCSKCGRSYILREQ